MMTELEEWRGSSYAVTHSVRGLCILILFFSRSAEDVKQNIFFLNYVLSTRVRKKKDNDLSKQDNFWKYTAEKLPFVFPFKDDLTLWYHLEYLLASIFFLSNHKNKNINILSQVSMIILKCQSNSEWIYEVIVSPKKQNQKLQRFLPYHTNKDRSTFFDDFLVSVGSFLATILVCLVGQKSF